MYNESLYEKYYKENIENISFIEYRKNFSMKEGEELINLGGTVITYLDMKSNIFNMLERYNVKTKKTHREIIPSSPEARSRPIHGGSELKRYINYLGIIDNHELPMITPGVTWELNEQNEIKTYGGYINIIIKNIVPSLGGTVSSGEGLG